MNYKPANENTVVDGFNKREIQIEKKYQIEKKTEETKKQLMINC